MRPYVFGYMCLKFSWLACIRAWWSQFKINKTNKASTRKSTVPLRDRWVCEHVCIHRDQSNVLAFPSVQNVYYLIAVPPTSHRSRWGQAKGSHFIFSSWNRSQAGSQGMVNTEAEGPHGMQRDSDSIPFFPLVCFVSSVLPHGTESLSIQKLDVRKYLRINSLDCS